VILATMESFINSQDLFITLAIHSEIDLQVYTQSSFLIITLF